MEMHAIDRAETLKSIDYFNLNFFEEKPDSGFCIINDFEKFAQKNQFLPYQEMDRKWVRQCQLKANKPILYRIPGKRAEWIQITKFYRGSEIGQVYCYGNKFILKSNDQNQRPSLDYGGIMPEIQCTTPSKGIAIPVKCLKSYLKDFLVNSHNKSKCKNDNCVSTDCEARKTFLSFWIHY